MEFFGYRIEKITAGEANELEIARKVLEKHGFRAVRQTQDKSKKVAAAAEARKKLEQKTRQKVQNAMNLLRFQDKPITAYRLAKEADISPHTAKKYLEKMGIKKGKEKNE